MSVITFVNKKTQIPRWVNDIHETQPRSYAYKKDGFCISIYGKADGLFTLSTGLTASEHTNKDLNDWATENYAAEDIETLDNNCGEVVDQVWRPGLYYQAEIEQALNVDQHERLAAEQSLYLLIQKLYEILLYIEPSNTGLQTYSHRTRELLILACTEIENSWQKYMRIAGVNNNRPTTNDYVRLKDPLHLNEYEVSIKPYSNIQPIRPFANWNATNPTRSLIWYDAYNKTKHDRENHFDCASLQMCIEAVVANIVMFCVRYGPFTLYQSQSITSSYFNQLFEISLANPDYKSFYVPKITFKDRRKDYCCGEAKQDVDLWSITALRI